MSRIGGAKAHRNGEALEALIERACERYARTGVAFIEKTPEPMRPIRPLKGGQFVACFTKSAQPDFKGTLCGGRSICFEAKHASADRIEQARVTPEQAEALDKHEKLGALCFVLVSLRFERFYIVPWAVWRDMPGTFGKVSANAEDLEPYRIPTILDFLEEFDGKEGRG